MQELIDLQIKIAYLEYTLESLNHVIAVQDKQLMDLQDQLKLIYAKMALPLLICLPTNHHIFRINCKSL